jgi:hypothetical protein
MKITALEESVDFATLDTEKLFSKLKSYELSRKVGPNHDASLTNKALIMLVATMLTPPAPLSHLLWSLPCPPCLQLLMSSTRASPTMRSPCWRESFAPCTSSVRRGDHLGAASSAVTPPTSSPTAPRGRSSTPPTSMTTPSRTTTSRVMTRRSTASGTRRRSYRR